MIKEVFINSKHIFLKTFVLANLSLLLTSFRSAYSLTDSTPYGEWKDEYLKYNCYAFAINRTELPPEFEIDFQYQPGDFSNQSISFNAEISTIANVVKDDLEELSYLNINVSTEINSDYDHTIAVRNGNSGYHFMKLSNDNNWYHKPGYTWVLKYNYMPSYNRVWTNEVMHKSGIAQAPTMTYDSTIYYISYDEPHKHDFSYKYERVDKKYHYSYCECGFKTRNGHVVTGSPNSYGEYNCLICGGTAELGFTIINRHSQSNIIDKSFLSENGVLFLSLSDYLKFKNNQYCLPDYYYVAWEVI